MASTYTPPHVEGQGNRIGAIVDYDRHPLSGLASNGEKPARLPGATTAAYDLLLDVSRGIIDDIDLVDWRRATFYAPDTMSSQEIALDVLRDLHAALTYIAGGDLPEMTELCRRISNCERRIEKRGSDD